MEINYPLSMFTEHLIYTQYSGFVIGSHQESKGFAGRNNLSLAEALYNNNSLNPEISIHT